MLQKFIRSARASLWNCYQETIPSRETVVFCIFGLCLVVYDSWKWLLRLLRLKKKRPIHRRRTAPSRKMTVVESIESQTRRTVAIRTSLSDEHLLAKCDPQSNSILFQLPKELRLMIFEYASTQTDKPDQRYNADAYYYRPGHTSKQRIYTSLLLTCRRVWLETHAMPMKLPEHAFWFQRGPYDYRGIGDSGWAVNLRHENDRYTNFLKKLTPANLQNLTHIHLFMQMFQAQEFRSPRRMEHFLSDYYLKQGLRPKIFHVTIRQSDWWDWEHDAALNLDGLLVKDEGRWVQSILDAPQLGGTQEFRLELETLKSKPKIEQLHRIIEMLHRLEGSATPVDPADNSNLAQARFTAVRPPRIWEWTRSTNLDGKQWPVFGDLKELKLHVAVLTWKKTPAVARQADSNLSTPTSVSKMTQSSAFPLPFSTSPCAFRSPAMIMKMRAQRALINEIPWKRIESFDQYAAAMRSRSDEQAIRVENTRRDRFESMIGDMVAKDVERRWTEEGSLLRFVEI